MLGALLADADLLISDDRDIVPSGTEHVYEHNEHRTLAVTFGHFIKTYFEPASFAWDDVDPAWLARAFGPPAP